MSQNARNGTIGVAGRATAVAGVNIALVKYWGKRDEGRNLPAVGSISLTLDAPGTRTTVAFDAALDADVFTLDGVGADPGRVGPFLDAVRRRSGESRRARVTSHNTVPTAAGLASSASGFAALGLAAWAAAGLPLGADPAAEADLVDLVREGSGSAPRSLVGGLCELDRESGQVRALLPPDAWDVRMVLALTVAGPKAVSSRAGMASSAETSPYFGAWVASHPADLARARAAIAARDLEALGAVMEHSTLKMHACMMAGEPALRYWAPATVALMDVVLGLRAAGVGAWFTADAGPHLKVLCAAADAARVAEAVRPLAREVRIAAPGPGATLLEVP